MKNIRSMVVRFGWYLTRPGQFIGPYLSFINNFRVDRMGIVKE